MLPRQKGYVSTLQFFDDVYQPFQSKHNYLDSGVGRAEGTLISNPPIAED